MQNSSQHQLPIPLIQLPHNTINFFKQLWVPALSCLHRSTPCPEHLGSCTSQDQGSLHWELIPPACSPSKQPCPSHQANQSITQTPAAMHITEIPFLQIPLPDCQPSHFDTSPSKPRCNVSPSWDISFNHNRSLTRKFWYFLF